MQIRALENRDKVSLARLDTSTVVGSVASLRLYGDVVEWSEEPTKLPTVKKHDLASYLHDPSPPWDTAYVVEGPQEGVCAFAASGYQEWNRRAILWHMYVDRSVRGQGIARALVYTIIAETRERGARQLWLETQDWNCPALCAYERLGFAIVGFDRSLYENPPAADVAVFMSCPLS